MSRRVCCTVGFNHLQGELLARSNVLALANGTHSTDDLLGLLHAGQYGCIGLGGSVQCEYRCHDALSLGTVGDVLVDFRFDYLLWNPFAGMYAACWGGKDEYGFVSYQGKVIIPNILTEYGEPCYGHMILETQDKMGILDLRTFHFVLPEYDLIEVELDEKVLFIKDGVKGYVIERTGQFIPADEYDEEYMSDEDIVYNTFD